MSDINIFKKHPGEVGMKYRQHMRFALMLAGKTYTAFMASVIHAFFPFFFTTTTSTIVFELYGILKFRIKEESAENTIQKKNTASL